MRFGDGRSAFALGTGTVTGWRQRLDLRTGVVTTTLRWRAPDGHVTDLRYAVATDRARQHVATVRLAAVPHWTGRAAVTDLIDVRLRIVSSSSSLPPPMLEELSAGK